MKKLLTILFLVCSISLTNIASAQTKSNGETTLSSDKIVFNQDPKFQCKQISFDDKTQIMTLLENVSLKTEKFELSNAGKVVYDQKTKKLTIYDCKEFTIDGKVVTNKKTHKKNIVEYTLGDDTVYIL